MAIAFDATSGEGNVQQSTFPTGFNSGNTSASATVGVFWIQGGNNTGSVTDVSWGGSAMSYVTSITTSDYGKIELWAILSPPSGVVTISGHTSGWTGLVTYALSYTGQASPTLPTTVASNTTASATSLSKAIVTVADNSWVIAFSAENNDADNHFTAGATVRSTIGTRMAGDSNAAITPAGSHTVSVAWTNTGAGSLLLAELPQGTAAATPRLRSLLGVGL